MRRILFAAVAAIWLCATSLPLNAAVTVETVPGQEWWQFMLSFPRADHPWYDKKGDSCYFGQRGDTWILADLGAKGARSCEVPEGVAVVVAVAAAGCFPPYLPGEWDNCDELVWDEALWVYRELTVDGVPFAVDYTRSGPYKVEYPVNGLSKFYGGTNPPLRACVYGPTIDGGNYAKIHGLEPGEHVIYTRAATSDGWSYEVTWIITVK